MDTVGPHHQNDPFSRSNEPQNSWPTRPKRPIYKVTKTPEQTSMKTLAIDPVGPYGQNDPFSRSNEPQTRISISYLPKFYTDTLAKEQVGPHCLNGPFSRSNEPQSR
ncbi:hypothetical protein H5410_044074 [Solanum commersonii]|uniref:Uncharacterized protein n=1 Tax=Solanum commersonii TaxID=4109 RepID=A0A9J5Y1Z7_SOLCO|nr:hypothetical protein H5410_044074 [Solanum commersonii]